MNLRINEFRGTEVIAAYNSGHVDEKLRPVSHSGNAVKFAAPCGAVVIVSAPRIEGDVQQEMARQGYDFSGLPTEDLSQYF